MPNRISVRSGRPAGPRPFSSEWLAADAPEASPATAFRLPAWVPAGRTISTAILVLVSIAAASAAILGGGQVTYVTPAPTQILTVPAPTVAANGAVGVEPTGGVSAPTAEAMSAPATSTTVSDSPPAPEFA